VSGLTAIGVHPPDALAAALVAGVLTFWLPVLLESLRCCQ
jgi:uncharacterized membrane protein YbhN (UPF0104 family)